MSHATPEKCRRCSLFCDRAHFCARLTGHELAELNAASQTGVFRRGEMIRDDVLERWPVFAIESGVISLQHLLRDGRRTIAAFFMRGDVIDLRNRSTRKPGHLIALSRVGVCRLSERVFDRIVGENPEARRLIWDNLRDQAFRAIDHSSDLAKKQALEKLASFIVECSHRAPQARDRAEPVDIPVRRRDLAEYLGMQPETVSRCFKALERRRIVKVRDLSAVEILDPVALNRIAGGARREPGGVAPAPCPAAPGPGRRPRHK